MLNSWKKKVDTMKSGERIFWFFAVIVLLGVILGIWKQETRKSLTLTIPKPPSLPKYQIPSVNIWNGAVIDRLSLFSLVSFPQFKSNHSRSIDATIRRTLNRLGIKIDPPNSEYPTRLSVKITGRAHSAFYIPGGKLYTGGEIKGELVLSSNDSEPYIFPVNVYKPPSKNYIAPSKEWLKKMRKPEHYRFKKLWLKPVVDFFEKVWGPPALVYLLDEENMFPNTVSRRLTDIGPTKEVMIHIIRALYSVDYDLRDSALSMFTSGGFAPDATEAIPHITRMIDDKSKTPTRKAIWALEKFGSRAIKSVPFLIAALDKRDHSDNAYDALRTITGKDFPKDSRKWKRWWFKYGKNILN